MKALSVVLVFMLMFASLAFINLRQSVKADMTSARGLWHFDEGSGSVASDSSGNNNHGAINGATRVPGYSGNALDFDGTNDYVEVPDSDSLKVKRLTLDVWIYPHRLDRTQAIVFKGNYLATPAQNGYYLSLGRDGQPLLYNKIVFSLSYDGNANTYLYSTSAIPVNTWTHVVAAYDGAQMTITLNDVQDSAVAYTLGIFSNAGLLRVGYFMPAYPRWFDGVIDEVQVKSETTVYISPDPATHIADYGSKFDLSVMVSDVVDLFGFDLEVAWDNKLIAYDSFDNSSLDTIWPAPNFWYTANSVIGPNSFKLAASSLGLGYACVRGQELFKIKFVVNGPFCNSVINTTLSFTTHKLSNSIPTPIPHSADQGLYKIKGKTPTINLSPANQLCHMLTRVGPPEVTEQFDVTVSIADAENVTGFIYDIRFSTALLDFVSLTYDSRWTTNSYTPDETGGKVTGSASAASGQNGTVPLMTIKLKPSYPHIWKHNSISGWTNDMVGSIYVQTAGLTYSGAPSLGYVKGGTTNGILVVPVQVTYTFSPIQGDLNNNGKVDILDLTTLCGYYDVKFGDAGWTTAEPFDLVHFGSIDRIIDIFDVIIISSKYGYTYTPP